MKYLLIGGQQTGTLVDLKDGHQTYRVAEPSRYPFIGTNAVDALLYPNMQYVEYRLRWIQVTPHVTYRALVAEHVNPPTAADIIVRLLPTITHL